MNANNGAEACVRTDLTSRPPPTFPRRILQSGEGNQIGLGHVNEILRTLRAEDFERRQLREPNANPLCPTIVPRYSSETLCRIHLYTSVGPVKVIRLLAIERK